MTNSARSVEHSQGLGEAAGAHDLLSVEVELDRHIPFRRPSGKRGVDVEPLGQVESSSPEHPQDIGRLVTRSGGRPSRRRDDAALDQELFRRIAVLVDQTSCISLAVDEHLRYRVQEAGCPEEHHGESLTVFAAIDRKAREEEVRVLTQSGTVTLDDVEAHRAVECMDGMRLVLSDELRNDPFHECVARHPTREQWREFYGAHASGHLVKSRRDDRLSRQQNNARLRILALHRGQVFNEHGIAATGPEPRGEVEIVDRRR